MPKDPKSFTLSSPIYMKITPTAKGKLYFLSMNVVQALHYRVYSKLKKRYSTEMVNRIPKVTYSKVRIKYTVYLKDRRRRDISNVCSIVDKFFCDVLVTAGVIDDDNFNYVPHVVYKFGSIDKDCPRMEIKVEEIQ